MPGLPERSSAEHLRKQAKRLHKAVRSADQDAMVLAGPYFGDPSQISLQQAQLVIARDYGFSSWAKLMAHVAQGRSETETTEQRANRFLDLVCLHYGPDSGRGAHNFDAAAAILHEHPNVATHSVHTAAAAGDTAAVRQFLAQDPAAANHKGGPFHWPPLMYAAYARLPGASTFEAGQVLLEAGADPDAHYLWGGTYRFAVLTGIFGDGEGGIQRLPEHPDMMAFARAVLDAGANPNDSQAAYNRSFSPDNTHLELMLEYGLKDSDPSDWWLTEDGHRPEDHRTMHFQLIMAMRRGFADRARLLIAHGVDLNTPDTHYYPGYSQGRTPFQIALMRGLPEIAELIAAEGGDATPLDGPDQFRAACMNGDLNTAQKLAPACAGTAPDADADMLREAAGNGNLAAVETMMAIGFDLNPQDAHTPLHAAAYRDHADVVRALLRAGADPKRRDPDHFAPPLAHAMHGHAQNAAELLMNAEMDIFLAAALGQTGQIDARLAEDPTWIDAPFSRVRPRPETEWHNDWAPPLWYAAMNGRTETVRYLLKLNAATDLTCPSGKTVADYADEAGHTEIAEMIRTAN